MNQTIECRREDERGTRLPVTRSATGVCVATGNELIPHNRANARKGLLAMMKINNP